MKQAILKDFNLKESAFIGEGGEAWVYLLDASRVLKIYKNNDLSKNLVGLQKLYKSLNWSSAGLTEQAILEFGTSHKSLYTIEKRIKGQDFCKSLKILQGRLRQEALDDFYLRAKQLHTLQKEKHVLFGDAIHIEKPRSKNWTTFLQKSAKQKVNWDFKPEEQKKILNKFSDRLAKLDYSGKPQLVHFDYFPANVMEKDARIVAIIDFSLAIYGDPLMDIAGTVGYLGLVAEMNKADTGYLLNKMLNDHNQTELVTLTTYLVYMAIYWSYCSQQSVADWAMHILDAWEESGFVQFSEDIWKAAILKTR
ncbi:aminoglycoside phosphotransferase family protein [Candidatus Saccharibacteria bacterium]|nr:aminoglycoside phosphotransferase family protein [Candidatus Saccharibacteria bacterium]